MKDYSRNEIHSALRLAALDLWHEKIVDRDNNPRIRGFFQKIGWSWITEYKNSEKFAWCGVFAAVCSLKIGDYLERDRCVPVVVDPEIARSILPSTQRLASLEKWRKVGGGAHMWGSIVDGDLEGWLIPGAIVTVSGRKYGDRRDILGGHIVIVDEFKGETFTTIEGNARGAFPDGSKGEGVIRRERSISEVRRVYLLRRDHLEFLGGDDD